jgi:UPF0176 protein
MKHYHVLAFYHITPLDDPHLEVKLHKTFFKDKDITSRIYISEHGINGQMSATEEDAHKYMDWMHAKPEFKDVVFKVDIWEEQAFPRQTVKYRKNLVACNQPIDFSKRGEHVAPEKWKEMLESKEDYCLLDVRNDYESVVGHFEGAELPPCKNFRDFEKYAVELEQRHGDDKPPVMMYCTGGIRCELYSSILKEKGFDKVYQLEGGVINYGHKIGSEHWLGKLFVFDDRLTVPISDEETPVISQCQFCSKPSDHYYNCANMDCNTLFISCQECIKVHVGCCQSACQSQGKIRPYHQQNPHKPFRRKHYYEKENVS